jgi:hypothetical protein
MQVITVLMSIRIHILISIFFSGFFFISVEAQFFGIRINDQTNFAYATALCNPRDGLYRTLVLGSDSGCCPKCKILVFDKDLHLGDSVTFPRGFRPDNNEPILFDNKLFWAAIYNDTLQPNQPSIFTILELDTFYRYKNNHAFSVGTGITSTLGMIKIHSRYYVAYWLRSSHQTKIYKLNQQFVKLDSIVLNVLLDDIKALGDQILISFPVDNFTTCISSSHKYFNSMKSQILDTFFNKISCRVYDSVGIYKPGNASNLLGVKNVDFFTAKAFPVSHNKYLAFGSTQVLFNFTSPFSPFTIQTFLMDKNHSLLTYSVYSTPFKNMNVYGYSNYVAVKGNEIVLAGIIGDDFSGDFPQSTKVFVLKLDTSGSLVWKKEFGGNIFYRTSSIVFTSDGGCLVAGQRFDSLTTPQGRWELFLLKLDKDGSLETGQNELREIKSILIFPNPTTGKFTVSSCNDCKITISDVLGRSVLTKKLTIDDIEIEIQGKGFYILTAERGREKTLTKILVE